MKNTQPEITNIKIVIKVSIIGIIFILGWILGYFSGQSDMKTCIDHYGIDYKTVKARGIFDHCEGWCYSSNITEDEFRKYSVCSSLM